MLKPSIYAGLAFALLIVNVAHADTSSCQLPDRQNLQRQYNAFQQHKWTMQDDATCLNSTVNVPADYFMLSLSFSPAFCAKHGGEADNAFQCSSGNAFAWVAHGLWAQSMQPQRCAEDPRKTQHPRYCQGNDYPLIAADEVAQNLCVQPGFGLVEKEWAKHGTCSGLSPQDYLSEIRSLYEQLTLPPQDMQPPQIYAWMRQHNPGLIGVRMNFDAGAHELRICYDKQFHLMNCP
jgi:ribonuclease T2